MLTGLTRAVMVVALAVTVTASAQGTATADARSPVPPEYRTTYRTLNTWLDAPFAVRPAARNANTTFGAHLLIADSNNGPSLLNASTLFWVDVTLDRFKELGIQGVTLAIGYPLFTPSRNADAQQYVNTYRTIAAMIRARGMKLAIEQIVLYSNSNFSPWHFDLSGLTVPQFTAEQHQMAQTIIDELHPDYLTVLHEPDTYAVLTGMSQLYDPAVSTAYVRGVLNGLDRKQTKVGAGSGTWSGNQYVNGIAAETNVDYIAIHVYWVNRSSVEVGKEMVATARAYGKKVVIDEAWLYKSIGGPAEGVPGLAGNEAVYRRDVFSFFGPLDRKFLDRMTRFAKTAGAEYFSPYWSNYFFAYLEYGPANKDLSYKDLVLGLAPQAVGEAIVADRFNRTGKRYATLIRQHRLRKATRRRR